MSAGVSGWLTGLSSSMKALVGIILKPSFCLIALASVPSSVSSSHLAKASRNAESTQGMLLNHLTTFSIASLSVSVCPYTNWVSQRQNIGFFFLFIKIHSTTLCLLIGEFSTCTFKLLIGMFLLPFCSLFSGCFIVLLYLFQGWKHGSIFTNQSI